jgi:predicted permease
LTTAIAFKLLAILATVALGWLAGRLNWLASAGVDRVAAARVLSDVAFMVFVPALLFRTTVRLDLASLPVPLLAAFFVPMTLLLLAVHAVVAARRARPATRGLPAAPATRAVAATFANSVQLGRPMAAALFGEAGLALHIALVSLHALVLLSLATALAEGALARERARAAGGGSLARTLMQTARQTVVHPVVRGPPQRSLLGGRRAAHRHGRAGLRVPRRGLRIDGQSEFERRRHAQYPISPRHCCQNPRTAASDTRLCRSVTTP